MSRWFDRLRFLWEEEAALPQEVPRVYHQQTSGVPRPLRQATRFALIGFVATSLMGQVIGVRLVAPVDAQPTHRQICEHGCDDKAHSCVRDGCWAKAHDCNTRCQNLYGPHGRHPNSSLLNTCNNECTHKQTECINKCTEKLNDCREKCNKQEDEHENQKKSHD